MVEEAQQDEVPGLNERLQEISRMIYGERAQLRIVSPESLKLLGKNARFMKKPTFDQLVQNVAKDKMLSSVPLVEEHGDGTLEVVSGNHRIKSAIAAGLKEVLVLVVPHVDNPTKVARQLSHNAIAGEDDPQILAELWKELNALESKLYSGLDSELVKQLEDMKFAGFNAEQVRTEKIVLWLLPEEVTDIEALSSDWADFAGAKGVYLGPLSRYQILFDALVKVKKFANVKNTAIAFMAILDRLAELGEPKQEAFAEPEKAEQV